MLIVFNAQVWRGLKTLFTLSAIRPVPWITLSVILSLAQTALSTIPVVSMVPLLQLFSSAGTMPVVVRVVARGIGTSEPRILIPVFALCIGVVFLLCSALSVLVTWWQAGRTARLGAEAGAETLRRYVSESYEAHRRRSNAEIFRNVGLPANVATTLSNVLNIFTCVLTLTAICAVLIITSPLVTIPTIVLFGGLMALTQAFLRHAQLRAGTEIAEASLHGWRQMIPVIDGFREVRLASRASGFLAGYRGALLQSMKANRVVTTLASVPAAVSQVVFALAVAGIAAILFSTGSAASAITVLGLFAAAAMRALPTLNLLFSTIGAVRSSQPNLEILSGVVDELGEPSEPVDKPLSSHVYRGDIVLDAVEFVYADSQTPIVRDLDLVIREHETIAIVGSSGAGKSTLIDIVLGLLTPTRGTVTCGGVPISDDQAGWHRCLGVVPQDVFLLNDTLESNITFGLPALEVDHAGVLEALRFAQLTPLLESLPQGLQTVVGERGTRLSGGQRQRLGLARAMYRRPSVLLLDEATSSLDNETEAEITKALRDLHGEVTIVVVAHRLSTVRNADKIVFLRDGVIAGEGTFAEVQAQSREFARLVELGKI